MRPLQISLIRAATITTVATALAATTARPAHALSATPPIDSTTIGIAPFVIDPKDTLLAPLSFGFPDLLTTDLSRSRQLALVERARLATILRELDLVRTPGVSQAGAPQIGRLVQARRIITGSLKRTNSNTVLFEAQINDVETGRVLQAVQATAPLNDLLVAEKEVALRIFASLGVVLTPAERALVDQMPTRNLAALLAYSQGVRDEVNGQYALAMRSFRAATKLDPGFSRANDRRQESIANLPPFAATTVLEIVNQSMQQIPTSLKPGMATDPAYPSAAAAPATIVINISRP